MESSLAFSTVTLKWKSSFSVSSLSHSHQLSSQPSLADSHLTWTDGCNSFHFLAFFQSVKNRLLKPRLYLHGNPLIVKCESWDWLHSFWSLGGVIQLLGGCHCCTHMTHVSHMHTTTHTANRGACLVWLQCVKCWMTAERGHWQVNTLSCLCELISLKKNHCPVNALIPYDYWTVALMC